MTEDDYEIAEKIDLGDLKMRSVRGGVYSLAQNGTTMLLTIFQTIVLARLLSPADFGLVAMVTVFSGFAILFVDLGLSSATIQKEHITHGQVTGLFWVNAAIGTSISVIFILCAYPISWFYGKPQVVGIVLALSPIFLINSLAAQHGALLRRQMLFGKIALASIVSTAIGVFTATALACLGYGYWSLIAGTLITGFVGTVLLWAASRWIPGRPGAGRNIREIINFGMHLTGFNFLNYFSRNLDNVLIGRVWGAMELGLYSRAYQLFLLPLSQVNAPFSAVAIPALSHLKDSPDRYRRAYLEIIDKLLYLTIPWIGVLAGGAEIIIRVLLGPGWDAAAHMLRALALVGFVQPLGSSTGWLFISQGRARDMFHWGLISSAIIITAISLGVQYGALGVAYFYSISGLFIATPFLFWFVGRKGPISTGDLYKSLIQPGSLCLVLFVLSDVLRIFLQKTALLPIFQLVILVGISGTVGLAGLWVLPSGRKFLKDITALIVEKINAMRKRASASQ